MNTGEESILANLQGDFAPHAGHIGIAVDQNFEPIAVREHRSDIESKFGDDFARQYLIVKANFTATGEPSQVSQTCSVSSTRPESRTYGRIAGPPV